ncbi:MAG: peptide ABC transporter substrate-binding protein [Anaerolineae bacterium]|nr:peptide ABC transporter substrate-binding protein [Gloeobacterales cyanobacterium ES-bin-313]
MSKSNWKRRQILALSAGLLAGCSRTKTPYFGSLQIPDRNILRVGNGSEPRSLDPHKVGGALGELNLCMALFEGLTEFNPRTLAPEPALALRWIPDADARAWTFTLRPGAKWSDGTPCTAQDFVNSWQRALDPATACPYVNLLYYMRNGREINEGTIPVDQLGAIAIDPLTLRVEMAEPTAYFPVLTAFFIFRPVPTWTIKRDGDPWSQPERMVTNGAFVLAEHRPYDVVTLERSETYWNRSQVKLEAVHLYPIVEGAQNVNLYQTSELDVTIGGVLPRPLLRELRQYQDCYSDGRYITYYVSFNCKHPIFKNPDIRRQLSGAVDRQSLSQKFLRGDTVAAKGFIPPGIPSYQSPPWPMGTASLENLPKKLTINTTNREPDRTVVQVLQRTWKEKFGIEVQIESEESQTFLARLRRQDYEVAVARWGGDYLDPTTFLNLYDGLNPQNYPAWEDANYRQLLKQAAQVIQPAQRFALLSVVEARLLDQLPIAPLFHTGLEYLQKPWVKGWEGNLQDLHPLKYVSIDRQWQAHRSISEPSKTG